MNHCTPACIYYAYTYLCCPEQFTNDGHLVYVYYLLTCNQLSFTSVYKLCV